MKRNKLIALVVAATFGLGVSAMAQGRSGGHPMGGPPAGAGPGMGGPGMGGPMGQAGPMGQRGPGQMGQAGPMDQTGQAGQTGTTSGPKTASDLLTSNSKLSTHLASTLGLSSSTLLSDASGFKNLGLFVASMRVSKNLNIPFSDLSAAVQKDGNLGKAIRSLQPNLSKKQVKGAVRTAHKQAKQDIRNSKG